MIKINAQEWIEKEYPKNGFCLGEFDKDNKGRKREEITKLDINIDPWEDKTWKCNSCHRYNRGSYCNNNSVPYYENEDNRYGCGSKREPPKEQKWLVGSLKLEGFIKLDVLNFYEKYLNNLEIVDSPRLKEFYSSPHNFGLILNSCSFLEQLIEQNINLQRQITNFQNQFSHLINKLNEFETTFDQQIKTLKREWNIQIRKKEEEIIEHLHRGRSRSAPIRKEINGLRAQVSEYKKLVQNLQTAKSLIDSLTKNINDKKLTETKNYLISFHQELQKDSKNRIWQGACQVLIKIKSKQKEFQQTSLRGFLLALTKI